MEEQMIREAQIHKHQLLIPESEYRAINKFLGSPDTIYQGGSVIIDWNFTMNVVAKIAEYRLAHPKETTWVCDCKIVVYHRMLHREIVNFCEWYNQTQTHEKNPSHH